MNSFLKSGFLLGLGAAAAGKEKLDETIMKLVEKGNMTQSEADTFFGEFIQKGSSKSEEWNQEFKEMAQTQLRDLGFVTKEELDLVKAQLILLKQEISQVRSSSENLDLNKTNTGMENIPPGFSNNVD